MAETDVVGLTFTLDGDVGIDGSGNLLVAHERDDFEYVRMVVMSSIRTFLHEVWTNMSQGIDWISIFQLKRGRAELEEVVRAQIAEYGFQAGASSDQRQPLEFISILFDGESRGLHVVLKYDGREMVI